jgi:hypothetical protein
MISRLLRINLKSDVVVSTSGATEGGHSSLTHLPGSLLLGASVVGADREDLEALVLGRIRFGNGLPVDSKGGPSWPMPLSLHIQKLSNVPNPDARNLAVADPEKDVQYEQKRGGFLAGEEEFSVARTWRMKTALDRETMGRARESQLFGYEAIATGQTFLARVSSEERDRDLLERVVRHLTGDVRLGRSRSAEYGEVAITEAGVPTAGDPPHPTPCPKDPSLVLIYLASDLALARDGSPCLAPSASDFGMEGFDPVPERTFLRTRTYSPWVAHRNGHDLERQVIVQGSVLAFRRRDAEVGQAALDALAAKLAGGCGLYRHEGLGRILVNPPWLIKESLPLRMAPKEAQKDGGTAHPPATPVQHLLKARFDDRRMAIAVETLAPVWKRDLLSFARSVEQEINSAPSKAQWSSVRQMAVENLHAPDRLHRQLLEFFGAALRRRVWNEEVRFDLDGKPRASLADYLLGPGKDQHRDQMRESQSDRTKERDAPPDRSPAWTQDDFIAGAEGFGIVEPRDLASLWARCVHAAANLVLRELARQKD